MKKLHLLALSILVLLGFTECKKSTNHDQATADVFIQATKNQNDTSQVVYAAVNSVFSYNQMTSVTAVAPDNTSMTLLNYGNLGNSFYNNPVYIATPPPTGVYTYNVKFSDGQEITLTNTLASNTLLPPRITSLSTNQNADSINISWNAVANAQAYQLKVTKGTGASLIIVYNVPPFMDSSSPLRASLILGVPLSTVSAYGAGAYTFELDALLYETSAFTYIQAIGVSTKDYTL